MPCGSEQGNERAVVIACFSVMPCGPVKKLSLLRLKPSRHRLFQRDALRRPARAVWQSRQPSRHRLFQRDALRLGYRRKKSGGPKSRHRLFQRDALRQFSFLILIDSDGESSSLVSA